MPILRRYGATEGLASDAVGSLLTRLVAVFDTLENPTESAASSGGTVPLKQARLPKVPKPLPADLEVEATATAEQPLKRAKTLRLSPKSRQPSKAASAEAGTTTAQCAGDDADAAEASATVAAETPESGPVLSPAERREAILRKLREEGDTSVPPRREAGDGTAPPVFRYPVNRFAR